MSKYKYSIDNSDSRDNSVILTLKPKRLSDVFSFKPGQYAMLSFYDSAGKLFINHPFSIASSPTQNNHLKFGIRILGKFTQTLPKLKRGEDVEIMGPFGDFIFDENKYQDVVFLAGGVGITPFMSAIQYATDKGLYNKIDLLYSNRTVKDTLFYDEIKKLAEANPSFRPKIKITQEDLTNQAAYCEKGYITQETILKSVGSVAGKDFFICGPELFMKAMNDNLSKMEVSPNKIHQEAFNNTPNLTFRKNYKNIFLVYGAAALLFIFFLNFVGLGKTKSTSSASVAASNIVASGGAPITLVNNVVNDRRNSIIATKQLLTTTVSAAGAKKTTASSASVKPATNTNTSPAQQIIVAPVAQQPIVTPTAPVTVPSAPRTRVS